MGRRPTVALLGEDRGHPSHRELNALRPRLFKELNVDTAWVPADSPFDLDDFNGVWLVPGSPYANDDAVYAALRVLRTTNKPFLGTCGGLQYAAIEFLRNVVGTCATHAESDGEQADNAVAATTCSLYGQERLVTPVEGSRFAAWAPDPELGMHYCNYAPTEAAINRLTSRGVLIGATAPDTTAEVLEFPDHPFYVASLFQPHIGASTGAPIHPLIQAFCEAAVRYRRAGL